VTTPEKIPVRSKLIVSLRLRVFTPLMLLGSIDQTRRKPSAPIRVLPVRRRAAKTHDPLTGPGAAGPRCTPEGRAASAFGFDSARRANAPLMWQGSGIPPFLVPVNLLRTRTNLVSRTMFVRNPGELSRPLDYKLRVSLFELRRALPPAAAVFLQP
jgi:hypothetical protein